ncbi:hypothetical protein SAMN04489713_10161 [Actinomadura madurae]|uniref:Uncharacterized protein n=1 Tax=Actinomadura madurae TaxID=1993 RepID=A0A1I4VX13_9ACTN|nr:hypothetical protein [Actinomadura madurae]SFN05834.1 hypothetical protein SAMN04489713_10161 [Actinomadura madurae]
MEDSLMDPAPDVPYPTAADGRERTAAVEEPTERAHPRLVLTPAAEPRAEREPRAGAVVSGIVVLLLTAELGRRAGAPARLTAIFCAGACAAVIVPRYAPAAPLPRLRLRPAAASAAP